MGWGTTRDRASSMVTCQARFRSNWDEWPPRPLTGASKLRRCSTFPRKAQLPVLLETVVWVRLGRPAITAIDAAPVRRGVGSPFSILSRIAALGGRAVDAGSGVKPRETEGAAAAEQPAWRRQKLARLRTSGTNGQLDSQGRGVEPSRSRSWGPRSHGAVPMQPSTSMRSRPLARARPARGYWRVATWRRGARD